MNEYISRRKLLAAALNGAAGLGIATGFGIPFARAATTLTGVEWGGAYLDSMNALIEKQSKYEIHLALHQGGAAAILPKIKASWPKPSFDFVAAWNPVFQAMSREGWMEPFNVDDLPNLRDVPDTLIMKNGDGQPVVIPRSLSGSIWYYRKDTCPIEITTIEDLLSPELKGQIVFPNPTINTNMAMVTIALYRGGDERNLEPGWDFVKELARSGNIGRVATTDTEMNNSISSMETSVSFSASGIPKQLSEAGIPIQYLSKMPSASGLKAVLYTEGWTVLKGGKTKEAFDFLNFCMSPEMNTLMSSIQFQLPTNSKSTPPKGMEFLVYSESELKESTYTPDWEFVSTQVSDWMKRWELEVVPLL